MGFSEDDIANATSRARYSVKNDGDINDVVRFILLRRRSAIERYIFTKFLKKTAEQLASRSAPRFEVAAPDRAVVIIVQCPITMTLLTRCTSV